MNVPHTECKIF